VQTGRFKRRQHCEKHAVRARAEPREGQKAGRRVILLRNDDFSDGGVVFGGSRERDSLGQTGFRPGWRGDSSRGVAVKGAGAADEAGRIVGRSGQATIPGGRAAGGEQGSGLGGGRASRFGGYAADSGRRGSLGRRQASLGDRRAFLPARSAFLSGGRATHGGSEARFSGGRARFRGKRARFSGRRARFGGHWMTLQRPHTPAL